MQKLIPGFVIICGLILSVSCGGKKDTGDGTDGGPQIDGTDLDGTVQIPDGMVTFPDVESEPEPPPEPGEFGYPCSENSDCNDLWRGGLVV